MRLLKIILVLFFLTPASAHLKPSSPQVCVLPIHLTVESSGVVHAFEVELATTLDQQRTGLMYRENMADDHGMLFYYPVPQHVSFWMKNTYISLDLVFIRQDGTIAHIAHDATPLSLAQIRSGHEVTGVLELNGGLAAKLGIVEGDVVQHEFFNNTGDNDACS